MEASDYLPEAKRPFAERVGDRPVRLGAAAGGVGATAATGTPFAGIGVGLAIEETGQKLVDRVISRPEARAERTMRVAAERIEERKAAGEELRDDHFAEDVEAAEELIEAALRASWNALEMRKADLIGRLIASAGFDKSVSREDLLQLIRLLEAVSWRQLLAMAWIERDAWDEQRMQLGAEGSEGSRQLRPGFEAELSELADIHNLIGFAQEGGAVAKPVGTFGGGQVTASSFDRVALTGLGATLTRLSELGLVVSASQGPRPHVLGRVVHLRHDHFGKGLCNTLA